MQSDTKKRGAVAAGVIGFLVVAGGLAFGAAPLENTLLAAVAPFTGALIKTTDWFAGVFGIIARIKDGYAENEYLKEENRRLAGIEAAHEDLKKENDLLRAELAVSSPKALSLISARVASFDPFSISRFIVIDKGVRDGVAEGMPVVRSGNVLVGKIAKTYSSFSHVLLITEKENKVSVKSAARNASGVLAGMAGNLLLMDFIEKKSPLSTGDLLVTSGLDGVYPKNLVVGWVEEIKANEENIFTQALVRPAFAGFAHTQVFVIADYLR